MVKWKSVSTLCLTQCDSLLRSLGYAPEFMLKHSSVQFLLILGCRVLPYLENSTKEGEVEQLHSDKEERWQSWCRKNWKVNCWFVFAVEIDQWACADSDSRYLFLLYQADFSHVLLNPNQGYHNNHSQEIFTWLVKKSEVASGLVIGSEKSHQLLSQLIRP